MNHVAIDGSSRSNRSRCALNGFRFAQSFVLVWRSPILLHNTSTTLRRLGVLSNKSLNLFLETPRRLKVVEFLWTRIGNRQTRTKDWANRKPFRAHLDLLDLL